MKKLFFVFTSFLLFVSCSKNDRGELIGVKSNKFFPTQPNGMVLIPSGSFTMGPSNPNAALDQNPTLKTVSVKAFYMDETEITNSEYRQFVNWV
ncbi:MAG: SUMF1/EgtB/PvdO family nonheme iron enzyme, partial [Flavobacteriaceae bacterium]